MYPFLMLLLTLLPLLPMLGLAMPTAAGSRRSSARPPAPAVAASPPVAVHAPPATAPAAKSPGTRPPSKPHIRRATRSAAAAANSSTVDTHQHASVNYFPDPVVHCSGRALGASGDDGGYAASLGAAVTAGSAAGLYGACNVNGASVDGDGSLAWKSGQVQVYYCNHAFAARGCNVNEYWRADALIVKTCGEDGGGWVTVSKWSLTIGRDPTNSGGSFRSECGTKLHGVNANFAIVRNATQSR